MTTALEQEPEINICASDKKSDSAKRSHANRTVNGKPPKKQKVASSRNNKPTLPKRENAEASSERQKQTDVSYRHLFTFTEATEQDKPSQSDKSTKSGFTFLNGDDKTDAPEKDQEGTAFKFLESDGSPHLDETEAQPSSGSFEHDMEIDRPSAPTLSTEHPNRRRVGNGQMNAGSNRKFAYQRDNRRKDDKYEAVTTQAVDVLMIPEDIEYRPDEILRIATRFCRQKSVEELEEEWCAPGGVRETMKRDFKQKRQNVTRGRKLGSSNKR